MLDLENIPEAVKTLVKAWQDGLIIADDSTETLVEGKFEDVPKIWLRLFEGSNTGKLITKLV
jgi:NADPH-dependent curcumin reductase CurA